MGNNDRKVYKSKNTSTCETHELYDFWSNIHAHIEWRTSNRMAGKRFEFHGDMSNMKLCMVDLVGADLRNANLRYTDLSCAHLSCADLSGADLTGTNLTNCDLLGAKLNSTKGLISTQEFLDRTFKHIDGGYFVYKIFNMIYSPNPHWVIAPGSIIEEPDCCMDRRILCGPGINVATIPWLRTRTKHIRHYPVWLCFIRDEWLDGVCVHMQQITVSVALSSNLLGRYYK